ncbi:SNF5-domain-containing protein [Hyphopichia burtonii NRRL Y-1933]|uniref:SNF5-domain-containing protein n=1 Tax=Hyphopichia burtonii NRRL Y-1933 TaxID=984485 RepID=A0A1E4RE98_9ASCO|nr:SNF5-domain-containing protein [Hyphopichia burtonii NRRL Y-1933]ODV65571.1 SNF5-domain-containing protein [Hyphopichia burtonii NRRL Y-1933]
MNFNPQGGNGNMNGDQAPFNPQQAGQSQNQQGAASFLPPQFANLSQQQIQHLMKTNPQFQQMIRTYVQNQRMLQQQQLAQQQMLQRGQVPPAQQQPVPPQQANLSGMNTNLGMAQRNLSNPQLSQQPQQMMGSPQVNPNGLPAQRPFSNSRPTSFRQQPQVPPSQQFPGQLPQQQRPLLQGMATAQGRPNMSPQGSIPPQAMPMAGPGTPRNAATMAAAAAQVKQHPNMMLGALLYRELTELNEWSEKLKKEGKEVPLDVKIYEELVKRDNTFVSKYNQQSTKSKQVVEGLVRDIKSYNDIKQLRMNAINLSSKGAFNNSIWGEGYQGYGNGISNTATQLIMPKHNKAVSRLPDIGMTDRKINSNVLKKIESGKTNQLVPIRLEFDQERDKFKLRDTFLWDLSEDVLPLDYFVRQLIEDYKFIPEQHYYTILGSINEQIKSFRKKPDKTMGELRIPIKVDVTINNTQLVDQFEWDILNSGENDAEEFALIMCDEMNLPGEFTTAIAHSIREQSQLFHRALFLIGYSFDGSLIHEDEIRSRLLPSLRLLSQDQQSGKVVDDFVSTLRNPSNVPDFTPSLVKLTQLEVERLEKDIERDSRRKRRHTTNDYDNFNSAGSGLSNNSSGGGRGTTSRRAALHTGRGVKVSLPDLSDVPKTFRTPAPSSILPGAIDLGVPDIYGYTEIAANRTTVRNPNYKPPNLNNEGGDDATDDEESGNDRVKYLYDDVLERFIVKIKLPRA